MRQSRHPQGCLTVSESSEGWHRDRWLTCNPVPKFWRRGDRSAMGRRLYFGTISSKLQGHTCKPCMHPPCNGVWHLASCSRTRPVKCGTSRCTMVQCYIWLCSQMHQDTPDHTQLGCWVWSVVQQTWTFQPIEVSITIWTLYVIIVELLIGNLGGIFTAQHCAGSKQFFNLLVHPKHFDDLNLKLLLISWPCRHVLGDQVFIWTSFVLLLTLSDCVLYLTIIRLNQDNHLLLVHLRVSLHQSSSKLSIALLDILQRS